MSKARLLGIAFLVLGILFVGEAFMLVGINEIRSSEASRTLGEALPAIREEISRAAEARASDTPATLPEIIPPELPETTQVETQASTPISNEMTTFEVGGYDYIGYLLIPSLEIDLPVMSEWDEERLEKAPCRCYGSVKSDDLVIAGHNFRSMLARLPSVKEGAEVYFADMDGVLHSYRVELIETLRSDEIERMLDGDWALSIYTCDYSGTRRITVRCARAEA